MTITINAVIDPATQSITGVTGTAITASFPFSTVGFTGLITYTSTALPTGLAISSTTGVISGTPTETTAATAYTVTATDSLLRTAAASVTITISVVSNTFTVVGDLTT
jgi:hypothetical protein